jgi:hypothetical protein
MDNDERKRSASFSREPSFHDTPLTEPITEVALPLASRKGSNWWPSGTAVVVAPYLALTANHVIDDHWKQHEHQPLEGDTTGSFELLAFQVLRDGEAGALWSVRRIWASPHTDAALLRLAPESDEAAAHSWTGVVLDFEPPPVGERVQAFGYHSPQLLQTPASTDDQIFLEWRDKPATTIGEVKAIFDRGRDSVFLKWPSFELNAKFMPSMSGGPVFNDDGVLCGLICASLKSSEESTGDVSYAVSLWPLVATEIDFARDDLETGTVYPVLSLVEAGILKSRHGEYVGLLQDDDGSYVRNDAGSLVPFLKKHGTAT